MDTREPVEVEGTELEISSLENEISLYKPEQTKDIHIYSSSELAEPDAEDNLLKRDALNKGGVEALGVAFKESSCILSKASKKETRENKQKISDVEIVTLPPATFDADTLDMKPLSDITGYPEDEENYSASNSVVNEQSQVISALKERISQLESDVREKNEIISRLNSLAAAEDGRKNSVKTDNDKNEHRKRSGSIETAGFVALAIGKLAEGREKAILRKIQKDNMRNNSMESTDNVATKTSGNVNGVVLAAAKLAAGRERLIRGEIANDISARTEEALNKGGKTHNSGLMVAVAAGKFSELREKAIMKQIEEDQLGEEIDSLVELSTESGYEL